MTRFIPRLTAPSKTDKRLIYYGNGGISIVPPYDKKTGVTIPNCVGYFHFRWLELLGCTKPNWKIPGCNAEDCYDKAIANGFKVGTEPKLGAGIVWSSGQKHNWTDGAGHIGVVEEIKANGDIIVSQSAFGGQEFYLTTITKASGYTYSADRPLVGFIYIGIEYDNPITPTPTTPKENYYESTIPERFKAVNKDGKCLNTYTYYKYAVKFADEHNCVIIDRLYNKEIYPEKTDPVKEELTATSYPDYTGDDHYRVRKSFTDSDSSRGSFQKWKNAFNAWNDNKADGYHVYDKDGKQLD